MRSKNDNTLERKLESMEWMGRYIKFISPDKVLTISKKFKEEYMTTAPSPQRTELATQDTHSTEGVQTCIRGLRDNWKKMEKREDDFDVQNYDLINYLLLIILENILVNNRNVELFKQYSGVADIARIVQEQPMPSEMDEEFQYNSTHVNQSFKIGLKVLM